MAILPYITKTITTMADLNYKDQMVIETDKLYNYVISGRNQLTVEMVKNIYYASGVKEAGFILYCHCGNAGANPLRVDFDTLLLRIIYN